MKNYKLLALFIIPLLIFCFVFSTFKVANSQIILVNLRVKIVEVERKKNRLQARVHEKGNKNVQYIEIDDNTLNGIYINDCEPTLSFRTAKLDNNKRLLIIGGGNHKCGFSPESKDVFGYKYLENEIKKYYPNSEILYKWNTRDCITLDKVPYIGEFSAFMPNTFVATGFNKWGMTTSNVSANIISDCILGKENVFFDVYNSKRLQPIKKRRSKK